MSARAGFHLCIGLALVALGACAATDQGSAAPSGYWSRVEEVGANPSPEDELAGGSATYYPYVQPPGPTERYGWTEDYGGYGAYGSPYGAGASGYYYGAPYLDPYYRLPPVIIVAPQPRPPPVSRPPPVNRPPPVSRPPPTPRAATPRPSPPRARAGTTPKEP